MTNAKPYRHRFPMTIIQHAVWLYHRLPLSYRDVQELLHQRGIQVSHETLRKWCIKFGPLFAEELRHREPRRGSRWHLDVDTVGEFKIPCIRGWMTACQPCRMLWSMLPT